MKCFQNFLLWSTFANTYLTKSTVYIIYETNVEILICVLQTSYFKHIFNLGMALYLQPHYNHSIKCFKKEKKGLIFYKPIYKVQNWLLLSLKCTMSMYHSLISMNCLSFSTVCFFCQCWFCCDLNSMFVLVTGATQRKKSLSESWMAGSECRYWPDRKASLWAYLQGAGTRMVPGQFQYKWHILKVSLVRDQSNNNDVFQH